MTDTAKAKLFMHGRRQAVRLPKEFRLPGKEVSVRWVGQALVLEPIGGRRDPDIMRAIFAKIDRNGGADFLPAGRPEQPPMPDDDRNYFDE